MKKILSIMIALMLIVAMAIPARAVTPNLEIPDMPEIPDISDDIVIDIPDEVFDDWYEEHPAPPLIPTEPTESYEEYPDEHYMDIPGVWGWFSWIRERLWWMTN